jgi:hypothetical protein
VTAHDIIEVSPREQNEIKLALAAIQKEFGFKEFTESSDKAFTNAVTNRFAEIGFVAAVDWSQVDVDDHSDKLYFIPTVSVIGRTEKKEIDYEEIARQVQSGEQDGKEGVLRPDGTLGDPSSRLIL